MQVIDQPWPHAIADDLVDPTWIKLLSCCSEAYQTQEQFGLYYFQHNNFNQEIMAGYAQYHDVMWSLLPQFEKFFPHRRPSEQLCFSAHLAVQPADYVYPTHCDYHEKIFSMITYVCPDQSHGTALHTAKHTEPHTAVEWSPGRTLIFAPFDDMTWHSYHSGPQSRTTLCGFFMRANTTE